LQSWGITYPGPPPELHELLGIAGHLEPRVAGLVLASQ